MALCVDASLAVAALLPQPDRHRARQLLLESLEADVRLVAPPLLFAEVTSVLRRHVHGGTLEQAQAVTALQGLLAMRITSIDRPEIYLRALDLAHQLGQARAYDVQYLAVAEIETCPVVTLDRGLYQSALRLGIAAQLIA